MKSCTFYKINSFKLLKIQLYRMGLLGMNSSLNEKDFGVIRNCVIYSCCISYIATTLCFFLFTAETIDESVDSFISVSFSTKYPWNWSDYNDIVILCDAIRSAFLRDFWFMVTFTPVNHGFNKFFLPRKTLQEC